MLFNSLSILSAKFGHGTNSKFTSIPVCAVKSLLSSTSALAGSQAAHPRVILSDLTACIEDNAKTIEETKIAILFLIFPPINIMKLNYDDFKKKN